MKLLKNTVIATTMALSLGTFSTTTSAICLGMACMYNKMTPLQAIMATESQVDAALEAIDNGNGHAVIIKQIKDALKATKEINANDKVDRNRMRANASLKTARKAIKNDDLDLAKEQLLVAKSRFSGLKDMLELSQADRTSQQTHFLSRIMGTADKGAGNRSSNK